MLASPLVVKKHIIGKGSHGTVYAGFHKGMNRDIAIKHIKDTPLARQEVRMLTELQTCPHIVRFHGAMDDDHGNLMLVMDMCEGFTAQHVISEARQGVYLFSEAQIRGVAWKLVATILHCHERGIMYGDIKPENIMLNTQHDTATLIDVGCARRGDCFYTYLGTPLYFAPEKFAHNYGFASDTWSAAVVLYMMVCGSHPFVHMRPLETMNDLEMEVVVTPLSFPHPRWDTISPNFKDLLAKMLVKNPSRRISIEEVAAHPWFSCT